MSITYELKRRDLWWGGVSLFYRNRVILALALSILALVQALNCFSGDLPGLNWAAWVCSAVFESVVLLVMMFAFNAVIQGAIVLVGPHKGVLGEHTLQIGDDGLTETTDVNQSLHKWPGIHSVSSTRRYVWINLTELNRFTVPKRYFMRSSQADEFVAELRRRICAARNNSLLTSTGV